MKKEKKIEGIIRINTITRNRVIGKVKADAWSGKVFEKYVYKSKHLFRKFDAWGIDAQYFMDVLLENHYLIRIIDKEERMVYEMPASKFSKYGIFFHFKDKRTGEDHRAQIFCPRRYFDKMTIDEWQLKKLCQSGFL